MALTLFLPLLLLSGTIADLVPRQTSNSTALRSSIGPISSTTSIQPCCWLVGGFQGVKVNTWYTPVTQYTATVVTTFTRYNGTTKALNSSTIYLAKNSTFTDYGAWGAGAFHADARDIGGTDATITVPGVPTTLIPDILMTEGSNYGVSQADYGNATTGVLDALPTTDLTVYSPTPYATFFVAIVTRTLDPTVTSFDPGLCGTSTPVPYISYTAGNWAVVNKTEYLPYNESIYDMWGENLCDDGWCYPILTALPAAPPNFEDGVTMKLPETASAVIVADPSVRSSFPWITNCFTAGGTGEPTVHIPVTQLTSDSSTFIGGEDATTAAQVTSVKASPTTATVAQTTSEKTAVAPTTTTPSSQTPIALTTSTPKTAETSISAATTTTTSINSATTLPATTISVTTVPATTISATIIPATTISATIISAKTIAGTIFAATTIPATTIPASTISATTIPASTVIAATPLGTTAAIVGGTTLSIGAIITQNGQTLTLVESNGTPAIVGTTAQVVTIGGQAYTASAVTGGVVVNGATITSGAATVINGETVSIAGTNLVIASGSSTTTQGLAGPILSGLGGSGGTTGTSSTSRPLNNAASKHGVVSISLLFMIITLATL